MKSVPPTIFGRWDIAARRRFSPWKQVTPPQLFVGSFLVMILLGTAGLLYLPGLYTDRPLRLLDAVFTATSAVCVTGLIVVDTATYFTFWGQLYLLVLIQLGGLGMITFTSLIIISLGRRLSLRHEALSRGLAEVAPEVSPRHLLRSIVIFTFILEAAGAVAFYLLWSDRLGWGPTAIWHAIFQSISAFCNAGFSTFSDSLEGFRGHRTALLVMSGLIIIGGIGFLTMEELYLRYQAGRSERRFRISLHSRIVLASTALLLLIGWAGYAIFEWRQQFRDMSTSASLINALFASATARTAGFNTLVHSEAADTTNFLTILLMAIGGSPGSTAGGLKTTTFALIGIYAWSRLRGREVTTFWERSVPAETIQRAVGLFVVGFGIMTLCIFVLITTEFGRQAETQFLHYMFETVSAFNTVGLSMGVTGGLSDPGRMMVLILMFLGRVGPLTFAAALAMRRPVRTKQMRYAYEDVVVG